MCILITFLFCFLWAGKLPHICSSVSKRFKVFLCQFVYTFKSLLFGKKKIVIRKRLHFLKKKMASSAIHICSFCCKIKKMFIQWSRLLTGGLVEKKRDYVCLYYDPWCVAFYVLSAANAVRFSFCSFHILFVLFCSYSIISLKSFWKFEENVWDYKTYST
jgi:hypothetical protein